MYRLQVRPPGGKAYSLPVRTLPVRIGRSPRAEVRLDDPFASRLHAELGSAGTAVEVADLGSGNGTYVNGDRVGGRVPFRPGDRLRIGNTTLELESDAEATINVAAREEAPALVVEATEREVLPSSSEVRAELAALCDAFAAASAGDGGALRRLRGAVLALLPPVEIEEALEQVLALLFERIAADRAVVAIEGEAGGPGRKVARLRGGGRARGPAARLPRSVVREIMAASVPLLLADVGEETQIGAGGALSDQPARPALAAPLLLGGHPLGLIYADNPTSGQPFTAEDRDRLATLAEVAALRLEQAARLEARLEAERARQEVASAREIQARLLPAALPQAPGFELAGACQPCPAVGGDGFLALELGEHQVLLALADVGGKGLDAALLLTSLLASLQAQAAAGLPLLELVASLNTYFAASSPPNRYITLALALLDATTGKVSFVTAGHPRPLVVRAAGGVERIESAGLPLGVRASANYREVETALLPGDVLLLPSDGLLAAADEGGEGFGGGRLAALVDTYHGALASELLMLVEGELRAFAGRERAPDDRTLLILRRSA